MKWKATGYVGLAFLLLLAPSFHETWTVQGITWSAPTRITPLLSIETKPYVIEDDQGVLWVVYESLRDSNPDIYVRKWDGVAWLAEERLTNHASADQNPAIVQLQNGTIILVWPSNRLGSYSLFTKRLNGAVWSAETQLTASPGDDSTPSLLETRNGTLWVFWTRQTVSGPNVVYDIYYKTYTNGMWTRETALVNSSASEFQQSVFEAHDGRIWALYASDTPGNFDLYYKTLSATWSPATRITTNTDDDRQAWIMQDLNGTIWAFWTRCVSSGQTCQDDIFYKVSYNLGGSWAPETQYTFDPQGVEVSDSEPAAINAQDKRVHIFWTTDLTGNGGDFDIYYSTSDPVRFHDLAVLSPIMAQYKPREGEMYTATVRVYNVGDFPENADLTVKIDGSIIGSPSTLLQPGQTAGFTYNWNTSSQLLGLHDLTVVAANVPGEARTSNNLLSTKFYVISKGDTNRDGPVNFLDLGNVGAGFLSRVGDSFYNSQADLNRDGKIDFLDLGIVGSTYGTAIILPPDFSLTSSKYYASIGQASTLTLDISAIPVSGLNSPVTLSASGFGSGVTAVFSPNTVSLPGTSTLTLTTSSTATTGNFTVIITGTNGTVTRSVNLYMLVLALADFTLSTTTSTLVVYRADSIQTPITLSSINSFNSPVSFTVSGLPTGVSFSINPNPATPPPSGSTTATLTLTATSTAATGTFTIVVTGTSGSLQHSLTLSLKVCVPLPGDINKDGLVNFQDLGLLGAAFLSTPSSPSWNPAADLDDNGVVNFLDLGILGSNFLRTC